MSDDRAARTKGPIILWHDYGSDGWFPESYATVKDALEADRYGSGFVITRVVEYAIIEAETKEAAA